MRLRQPLLLTAFVCTLALVGCGGTESELAPDEGAVDSTTSAARGGGKPGTSPSPVTLTATPVLADRNANTTISLYPGAYADQRLFIKWQCYQDGAMRAQDGTYELHEAVAQGEPGYSVDGGRFDWTFVVTQALNENLFDVPASCEMQAWAVNRKAQWSQIARGTFGLQ